MEGIPIGTKYSSVSDTGYNASAPSDDGTAVSSNEVTWSFIKTKLADVVRQFSVDINAAILTHTDESVLDKAVTYTTTAADHKRTINVTASATQSLGDAATMATGYIVTIKNSHTAAITVDLATGADTLDGTAAGSLSLEPDEAVTVAVNSSADGYLKQSRSVEEVALLKLAHPVGSIYTNKSDSTNPATLFGFGTWVAIEDAFLIGASATYAAESTGGSKDAIVVDHDHTYHSTSSAAGDQGGAVTLTGSTGTGQNTGSTGSSGTDANLPPYVAVYMWERTV